MSLSPFAEYCADYIERGLSIVPIVPRQKFPGYYDGTRWKAAEKWSQYSERLMSVEEIEAAETWPNAGIGLLPGKLSGVVALDWDYDGGVKELLEAITPPSLVRKVGSKGYTAFYRYNGEVTKRWSVGGERVLELLSCGTQTVMPGSIHPGTGLPYYWSTMDSLLDIDFDELATLPGNYFELVGQVLAPYRATATTSGGRATGDEIEAETLPPEDIEKLCQALNHIPADDREIWIRVGMALKSIGDDPGFNIWNNWSRRSDKYDVSAERSMRGRWNGFKVLENGVSYRTIFTLAIENGYTPQVDETPRQVIKPGPVGNMARAAMEHAIRTGTIQAPEYVATEEIPTPTKPIKQGQQLLTLDELGDMRPPDWLIKGIQISDSLAMTYGASGSGKSFHVLDKGLHVAAGKEFHGRPVKGGTVVYVVGEGRAGVLKRVNAWLKRHGVERNDVKFLVTRLAVPFLDPNAAAELAELIHNLPDGNPVYIIVDTLNRNFGDGDENSTKDMSAFIDALDEIRVNTNACVEVVHHTGKAEGAVARGSSTLRAAMDTEISVKEISGGKGAKVSCTKQKDAEPFESLVFNFETVKVGEIEGEAIESLVCIPDETEAANQAGKTAMLEGAGAKITKNRASLLVALKTVINREQHRDPFRDLIRVTRDELHEKLKLEIGAKTSRNDQFNWASGVGLLTAIEGEAFDIHVDVYRSLAGE